MSVESTEATPVTQRVRTKGPPAHTYISLILDSENDTRAITHNGRPRRLVHKGAYDERWPKRIRRGYFSGKYPSSWLRLETRDAGGMVLGVQVVEVPDLELVRRRREKARRAQAQAKAAAVQQEQALARAEAQRAERERLARVIAEEDARIEAIRKNRDERLAAIEREHQNDMESWRKFHERAHRRFLQMMQLAAEVAAMRRR
jgi:hypothetical protein